VAGGSPYIHAIGIVQMNNGVAQPSTYFIYQGGASYASTPMAATVGDLPFTDSNYPAASGCSGTVNVTNTLNSLAGLSPTDFYTPYVNTYTTKFPGNDGNTTNVLLMPQELSRLDLDFGVCGPVLITTSAAMFMFTCDKVSNLYVTPTPEISGVSLGMFQKSDQGLSGGSTVGKNIYETEAPFQISRTTDDLCETIDQSGASNGQVSGNCDEVHGMPWFNDIAAAWPSNEQVELFQGTLNHNPNSLGGTTYQYTFGTGPAYDPCNTMGNCSGSNPPFPPAAASGGLMAIAASDKETPATLWSDVPIANSSGGMAVGSLYGYSIDFTTPSLSKIWQWNTNGSVCSSLSPPVSGWFPPSFTEPTLADGWPTATSADGAVYIATVCVVNNPGHTPYQDCAAAATAGVVESGIVGFTDCP